MKPFTIVPINPKTKPDKSIKLSSLITGKLPTYNPMTEMNLNNYKTWKNK